VNVKRSDPEDLIRAAYDGSGDCPPPESFLEEELARLSPAERARLMEHADSCPACGAERELAREFDSPSDEGGLDADALDSIVARLENEGPLGRQGSRGEVVPIDRRRRSVMFGWRGLAAAAVIALAALGMWVVNRSTAPGLPSIGPETTVRGTRIEVVQPIGDLPEIPTGFEWKAAPEAKNYTIRLFAVDDSLLWESTVFSASAALPADLGGQLHPAVVYIWQVEAFDPDGNRVARSERVRFRVRPDPSDGSR